MGISQRIDADIDVGDFVNQAREGPQVSFEALCHRCEIKIVTLREKAIPTSPCHRHITHDRLTDRGGIFTDQLSTYPAARAISSYHHTGLVGFFIGHYSHASWLTDQLKHFLGFTNFRPA